MTTLYRYYGESDELDSSLSISVTLIMLSLIASLGFIYGFPEIRQNSAEVSLKENFNTIQVESSQARISNYPEPGSLAF